MTERKRTAKLSTGIRKEGMALICFILPAVLSWGICLYMRKKGWINSEDLKLEL